VRKQSKSAAAKELRFHSYGEFQGGWESRAWSTDVTRMEGAQEEVDPGEKCKGNENKFTPVQINYALQ
jgi:hypothetical protein